MTRASIILACVAWSLSTLPVSAADLRPPSYRFEHHSTAAGWAFSTDHSTNRIPPDANVPLLLGDVHEILDGKFPLGASYPSASTFGDVDFTYDNGGGYFGGALGDGGVVFVMPNEFEVLPDQRLRIQVMFQGPEPPVAVVGYAGIPGTPVGLKEIRAQRAPVQDPSLPAGSNYFFEDWGIYPSATWYQVIIRLPAETVLQHVVIDSLSLDEHDVIFDDEFEPRDLMPWQEPKR